MSLRRATALLIVAVWLVGGVAVLSHEDRSAIATGHLGAERTATTGTTSTASTTSTTTTTTTVAPTTTAAPTTAPPATSPPTTSPPATAPPAPTPEIAITGPPRAPAPWTFDPYIGLGTWVDVYDWSETHGGAAVGFDDIDAMAASGVQTLYIQTARADTATDVLERPRLTALIDRAHADGLRVVGWYLPYHEDPNADYQHLMGIASLPVDGLAVDIESTHVEDIALRNQRLVELSAALRQQLPGRVLSAIVLPPVVTEVLNTRYWPDFPWETLANYYDLWQPMGYFTFRTGYWRDAYTYTAENIDRIRAHVGSSAIVHPIGGIGDETTADDVNAMLAAVVERQCIGGSLYDWRTTPAELWPALQAFRVAH